MNNKIILTSWGLQTPMGYSLIREHLSKEDCIDKSILLITLFSEMENEKLMKACEDLGFSRENIVLYKDGVHGQKARFYDAIYVGEGNTFELLHFIRKNDLEQNIFDWMAEGARYIGIGAGAHIAGVDIEAACSFDENNVKLEDFKGLYLDNGVVIPHADMEPIRNFEVYQKAVDSGKYAYIVSLSVKDIVVLSDEMLEDIRRRAFELILNNIRKMLEETYGSSEEGED